MDDAAEGLMRLALKATPPNDAEAARWAQKAASNRASHAEYVLVWCYLPG